MTAEAVFQRLAALVEEAEERNDPIDWRRAVAERMIGWRGGAEGLSGDARKVPLSPDCAIDPACVLVAGD